MSAPGQKPVSVGPRSIPSPATYAIVAAGADIYSCDNLPASGQVDVTADFITDGDQSDYTTLSTAEGKVKCHAEVSEEAPSFQVTFDSS